MKKQREELVEDVESLVESSTLQEAAEKVWQKFEESLAGLDQDSIYLLRQHFDGKPITELARSRGLPEAEVQAWLTRVKRQVRDGLRRNFTIRQ
jgi:DNA-directed RNA polymerase specialized sigma24 family protein